LQTSNGVSVEKLSGNPYQIWVVSRGLSVFERFDLRAVPKEKRDYALKQQVQASSPYRECDFSVRWSDGYAAVWIWDKAKQTKAAQQVGVAQDVHVFAEPSILGTRPDGVFGFQGIDIFFQQIFRDGQIQAEMSWPEKPTSSQLESFYRANGADEKSRDVVWHDGVYDLSIRGFFALNPKAFERAGLNLALFFFLLIFSYQVVSVVRIEGAISDVSSRTSEYKEANEGVIDLREVARKRKEELASLFPTLNENHLEVIDSVSRSFQAEEGKLIEWRFDGSVVQAVFEDPVTEPETMVESLEKIGYFEKISVDLDATRNRVKLFLELANE
tara:strand:- start:58 stop:1044 length:987 start_codon:yes stop_codon:yes gene_type:complete